MQRLDDEAMTYYRQSREAWLRGDEREAVEYYRMLRMNHACDIYYEVNLPPHARLIHPVGAVLGRATYGDFFVAYNSSGVGGDIDGNKPVIGDGVVLFPGARVLGRTTVGNNCWITANTVVQDCNVPDNSVVFMDQHRTYDGGNHLIGRRMQACSKPTTRSVKQHYFPGV